MDPDLICCLRGAQVPIQRRGGLVPKAQERGSAPMRAILTCSPGLDALDHKQAGMHLSTCWPPNICCRAMLSSHALCHSIGGGERKSPAARTMPQAWRSQLRASWGPSVRQTDGTSQRSLEHGWTRQITYAVDTALSPSLS